LKTKTYTLNYLLFAFAIIFSTTLSAQWAQVGIDIDGEFAGDQSGYAVSTSDDGRTVAIGAPHNSGNGFYAGHVRVYKWNGIIWVQLGNNINGKAPGDQSGYAISISADGETVSIGAYYNDGNGDIAGHVRIYKWNEPNWTQLGNDIDGEFAYDQSGYSVSLSASGEAVAIGAPANDESGFEAGNVRIYKWSGSSWLQLGNNINGEAIDDYSGGSVSMSDDGITVAIGASGNDGNGTDAGHVRIFKWNGTSWIQLGSDIDGEAIDDYSGGSVSMSDDGLTVAIGASGNDGNGTDAGHVRIYKWNGTNWVQKGNDIDGEFPGDESGHSVSMSANGETVAIGAPLNNGNGAAAGNVRIYNWNGANWIQSGDDIDGEAEDDLSGASVSMSADGETVAIGAIYNAGNGSDAGHVRIFNVNGGTGSVFENSFDKNLLVYPNPSSGDFSIDLGLEYESANIIITNVLGQVIYSTTMTQSKVLNLSLTEPAGVYFVSIETDYDKGVVQLIIE
jgi:hypothetical protein